MIDVSLHVAVMLAESEAAAKAEVERLARRCEQYSVPVEFVKRIEAMTYEELLRGWRFNRVGHPDLALGFGRLWMDRMNFLRSQPGGDAIHVSASKAIGWEP